MFLSCFYFLGFGILFVALFGEYYLKIKKKTMYLENVLFINVVSGKYVSQDAEKNILFWSKSLTKSPSVT